MKKILLILIGLSSIVMATVTSSGGVATDDVTNLQWQDDNVTKSWQDAIDYCEALDLGEKDDWRLPNKNELISIVDYSKISPALVNGFDNQSSGRFWSSTTCADNADNAWYVYFGDGGAYNDPKGFDNPVRCVRGGL